MGCPDALGSEIGSGRAPETCHPRRIVEGSLQTGLVRLHFGAYRLTPFDPHMLKRLLRALALHVVAAIIAEFTVRTLLG